MPSESGCRVGRSRCTQPMHKMPHVWKATAEPDRQRKAAVLQAIGLMSILESTQLRTGQYCSIKLIQHLESVHNGLDSILYWRMLSAIGTPEKRLVGANPSLEYIENLTDKGASDHHTSPKPD